MCRLLCVRSDTPFDLREHLDPFAEVAESSREFQGHGWGCAWLEDGRWRFHHDIRPVWKDPARPRATTTLLLAHARSAFRDEGIVVENNMPFSNGERVFIFNGELRGVRVKAEGRIGAEKIFNTVLRFDKGDLGEALERGVMVIDRRTRYVRAMNIIMATPESVHVSSLYNEDPDYFDMQVARDARRLVVCSRAYPGVDGWAPFGNRRTESFTC